MYELQLFNPPTGRYVPNVKGENVSDLRDLGRLVSEGDGFRIVSLDRGKTDDWDRQIAGKPLPLKPRTPYGCSGKPKRYKPDTMIEPATTNILACRFIDWYSDRLERGESITVHLWQGATLTNEIMSGLRGLKAQYGRDKLTIVELDPSEPGSAFGPDDIEQLTLLQEAA